MRVTFVGKSGAGKSAVAGLLCSVLARRAEPVVAVDADTVPGLAQVLGFDPGDRSNMSGAAERTQQGRGWQLTATAAEVLERFTVAGPLGLRFLHLGNVAGPQLDEAQQAAWVAFSRMVPEFDRPGEWLVVDTAGGILHTALGWTGGAGTLVVVVVEPFAKSLLTARRISGLAADQPSTRLLGLANKVRSSAERDELERAMVSMGITPCGAVPFDTAVRDAERAGTPLVDLPAECPAMRAVYRLADGLRSEFAMAAAAAGGTP